MSGHYQFGSFAATYDAALTFVVFHSVGDRQALPAAQQRRPIEKGNWDRDVPATDDSRPCSRDS